MTKTRSKRGKIVKPEINFINSNRSEAADDSLRNAEERFREICLKIANKSHHIRSPQKNLFPDAEKKKIRRLRPSMIDRACLKSAVISSTPMPSSNHNPFTPESSGVVSPITEDTTSKQRKALPRTGLDVPSPHLSETQQGTVLSVSSATQSMNVEDRNSLSNNLCVQLKSASSSKKGNHLNNIIEKCTQSKSASSSKKGNHLNNIIEKCTQSRNAVSNGVQTEDCRTIRRSEAVPNINSLKKLARSIFQQSVKERQTQTGASLDYIVSNTKCDSISSSSSNSSITENIIRKCEQGMLLNIKQPQEEKEENRLLTSHNVGAPWRAPSGLREHIESTPDSLIPMSDSLEESLDDTFLPKLPVKRKVFANKKKLLVGKARNSGKNKVDIEVPVTRPDLTMMKKSRSAEQQETRSSLKTVSDKTPRKKQKAVTRAQKEIAEDLVEDVVPESENIERETQATKRQGSPGKRQKNITKKKEATEALVQESKSVACTSQNTTKTQTIERLASPGRNLRNTKKNKDVTEEFTRDVQNRTFKSTTKTPSPSKNRDNKKKKKEVTESVVQDLQNVMSTTQGTITTQIAESPISPDRKQQSRKKNKDVTTDLNIQNVMIESTRRSPRKKQDNRKNNQAVTKDLTQDVENFTTESTRKSPRKKQNNRNKNQEITKDLTQDVQNLMTESTRTSSRKKQEDRKKNQEITKDSIQDVQNITIESTRKSARKIQDCFGNLELRSITSELQNTVTKTPTRQRRTKQQDTEKNEDPVEDELDENPTDSQNMMRKTQKTKRQHSSRKKQSTMKKKITTEDLAENTQSFTQTKHGGGMTQASVEEDLAGNIQDDIFDMPEQDQVEITATERKRKSQNDTHIPKEKTRITQKKMQTTSYENSIEDLENVTTHSTKKTKKLPTKGNPRKKNNETAASTKKATNLQSSQEDALGPGCRRSRRERRQTPMRSVGFILCHSERAYNKINRGLPPLVVSASNSVLNNIKSRTRRPTGSTSTRKTVSSNSGKTSTFTSDSEVNTLQKNTLSSIREEESTAARNILPSIREVENCHISGVNEFETTQTADTASSEESRTAKTNRRTKNATNDAAKSGKIVKRQCGRRSERKVASLLTTALNVKDPGELDNIVNFCDGERIKAMKCAEPHPKTSKLNIPGVAVTNAADMPSGLLKIDAGKMKPKQLATNYTLSFIVIEGQAQVGVQDKCFTFNESGMFLVPKGGEYYIKNLNEKKRLVLSFTKLTNYF